MTSQEALTKEKMKNKPQELSPWPQDEKQVEPTDKVNEETSPK